jgi:hypothetical protein
MTESEWLTCDDPDKMLRYLACRASDRKLRMFGCACCRRIWPLLTDPASRRAVESAEAYADGLLGEEGLADVRPTSMRPTHQDGWNPAAYAAHCVTWQPGWVQLDDGDAIEPYFYWAAESAAEARCPGEMRAEAPYQAAMLRCICGNPFQPVTADPGWQTPTVTSLAAAAYYERDLPSGELDAGRLAVLADALEDAGCDNAGMLGHLRSPGVHARGCWALDLLLGRR